MRSLFRFPSTLLALTLLIAIFSTATLSPAVGAQTEAPAEPAQAAEPAPTTNPQIVIETSMGRIVAELYADKAPKTVENFLAYVKSDFFAGTVFHRVIPGFMVQGGGFTADLKKKPTQPPVENEADNGLRNERGTLAMARTNNPHSATAQFFVNLVDNGFLDHRGKNARGWGYAVFGRVVDGMNVVDAIASVKTGNRNRMQNVPLEPVTLNKVSLVDKTE